MQIVVGSRKSYKIEATISACRRVFSDEDADIAVLGVDVESGVANQPMTHDECIRGARNRATAALIAAPMPCELGIGIENGLVEIDGLWFATTWIVATEPAGNEGMASTLLRPVPTCLMKLVEQGHELSTAIRMHYGDDCDQGLIDLITCRVLRKQDILCDGIITAMSPLVHHQLFTQR